MNVVVNFKKRLFACAVYMAGVFIIPSYVFAADGSDNKSQRRDLPWVSLANQRKLDGYEPKQKKDKSDRGGVLAQLAEDSAPQLSADNFEYADDGSGKLVATGDAKITDKNFEIKSDILEYSQNDGYADAKGNVVASVERARIVSENISVNVGEDSMKSGYIRFGVSPTYVEGQKLDADKTKVDITDTTLYFGEPDWASMNAGASSVRYDRDTDLLEMEDVTLRVGPVPFMYIPYYSQHGLKKPPIDAQLGAGYNDDYGFFLRNNIYYNGLEDVSPGLLLDYYTKRSVLVGPALEYDFNLAETIAKGWTQNAYINDHGSRSVRGTDVLGRQIGNDRFFSEWRHNQIIADRIGITGNLSWWSDDYVTRDFRPNLFYDNQSPDNFGEAIYYGDFFTASVFTRFSPNDWQIVQQRLPEVRVDMQPIEVFNTGVYQNFFASYAYLRDLDPLGVDSVSQSNRADVYYGLSRPIQLNSWSKFTPVVGGRLTNYTNAVNGSSTYTRMLGQIGFDAQMDIWGSFDYKSETMGIDGIRHHMIPLVSYRYIPAADQGQSRIPEIDRYNYLNTYPPILDLGALRNADEILPTNTMRFGLQNVFETRDESWGSREIARFDIYQDINFERRRLPWYENGGKKQTMSDLYVNASVSPARWLTLGSYFRTNFDHIGIPEVNSYIGLFDGDALSVYFISSYLQGQITQYSAHADYRISERYKLTGRWGYDYRENRLTEQAYGLWTRISETWVVEYIVSNRSGAKRQDNFSFGVRVNMMLF